VHDGSTETPEAQTTRAGVRLRLLDGPVEKALLDAIADLDVIVAVIGARATAGGRRPAGRTAVHVLERATKPVVVAPPEAWGLSLRPFQRLLVPLEGTEAFSLPVTDRLAPLIARDIELVVLHVFSAATLPRVLDHPGRDLELLGGEFLARHCPHAARIEIRTGPVGSRVVEVCGETSADLVVLSWSQDSSAGHAAVVRDVLDRSTVPVLLLASRQAGGPGPDDARLGGGTRTLAG
jgi:Universal stress protein family